MTSYGCLYNNIPTALFSFLLNAVLCLATFVGIAARLFKTLHCDIRLFVLRTPFRFWRERAHNV